MEMKLWKLLFAFEFSEKRITQAYIQFYQCKRSKNAEEKAVKTKIE